MNKLTSFMRSIPTRFVAVLAIAVAAVVIPVSLNAWGPERQTYTIEQPADRITFNSITNNPNLGDERNFTGARELGSTGPWKDNLTAEPGKTYEVRIYVHNNAADNLNLVAENVRAKATVPTTTGKSVRVMGFVNSSNATPTEVYDQADFTSDQNFNLAYVAGSAKYYNNVFGKYGTGAGTQLPDSLVTSAGATLGYNQLDGKIPGCFQYAGVVVFHVKPQFATPSTDFTVKKDVKKAGTSEYVENLNVNPGDKVTYRIQFRNTGQAELKNVVLKDTLPKNVSIVPGTVRILNAANPSSAYVQDGDKLVTSGVNIGSYTGGGSNAIVIFDATVAGADKLECGKVTLRNVASATPEGQTPKEDDATVTTEKECEEPKKIKVCELSTKNIITIDERDFDSSKHSKNLDDCKEVVKKIEVCDLTTKEVVTINEKDFDNTKHSKNLNDCKETPKENCPIPGKEHLPKDSADCKETPVTPTTPTTPTELPETGVSGAVASVLGLGSLTTATGYYVASRRALRS